MGKVTSLGQGLHLSISTLAAEFGMQRETVSKRLADAKVKPSGKRGAHSVYRLKDAWPALMGGVTPEGNADPEKMDPFKRQAHYKAELDRLKLQTEMGELIPRMEVEQEMARHHRLTAQMLDTLPDVLERDCGLGATNIARVERAIDEVREALYASVTDDNEPVRERS